MHMTCAFGSRHDTPVGVFSVLCDEAGRVLAAGFTIEEARLLAPIHPSLRPSVVIWRTSSSDCAGEGAEADTADRAVGRYLAGELAALDDVEVAWKATPFRDQAWRVMRKIPAGSPISYGELALRAGGTGWEAARAAGQACARNPVSLFVP